jgi:hypothetical protein
MTTTKAEPHAYHNGAVASAVIDDVFSRNIDAKLQEHLLDLFRSAMVSVATTLALESKFDTTDFVGSKDLGCDGFKLRMGRVSTNPRDFWFGAFRRSNERLDVVGHLRLL